MNVAGQVDHLAIAILANYDILYHVYSEMRMVYKKELARTREAKGPAFESAQKPRREAFRSCCSVRIAA